MNRKRAARIAAAGLLIALAAAAVLPLRDTRAQTPNVRGIRVQGASGRKAHASAQPSDPSRGEAGERARALVEEGLRYADGGKWDEALKAYKQAVEVDPRYSDAYLNMGDAYMSAGKYKEGFAAYRQAIAASPTNADAFYSLGAAYNDMGQYGDAFKPFVAAINLRPDFAEAHYGIGFAYMRLENFRDALIYLRRAVHLAPDYADAHLALGLTYLGLHNAKAAEAELKILADLDASAARELEKELRGADSIARAPVKPRPVQDSPAPSKQETTPAPVSQQSSAPARQETSAPARQEAATTPAVRQERTPPARPAREAVAESPRPSSSDSLLAVELSFWDSIKNSSDPEEFAAYLRKYPQGQFAELAGIRFRALSAKAGAATRPEATPQPPAAQAEETHAHARSAEVAAVPVAKESESKAGGVAAADAFKPPSSEKVEPPTPAPTATPAPTLTSTPTPTATPTPVPTPAPTPTAVPTPTPTPTPVPTPAPTPTPSPTPAPEEATTAEAALAILRDLFPAKFTYKALKAGPPPTSTDVSVSYEPVEFGGCRIEWKDSGDTLLASLAELDPESVKVAARARPDTTFSRQVWEVSIASVGGVGAFTETKGDGSGAVNRYNGLDLQYDDKAKAERVAAALRRAIEFCNGRASP